jgi:hypothetical protein
MYGLIKRHRTNTHRMPNASRTEMNGTSPQARARSRGADMSAARRRNLVANLESKIRRGSTVNDSTFDIFGQPDQAPEAPTDPPIRDAQVQQLREAFAAAGIDSMDDRRAIIESCTIRQVASIRELLAKDVRPILRRIEERSVAPRQTSGSVWDNRDEDTWIDKL